MRTRDATADDRPAISELLLAMSSARSLTRYHAESLAPAQILEEIDPDRGVIAVVGRGDVERLVGVAAWTPTDAADHGHVELAVAEGWRQADVATRLLAHIGRNALRRGVLVFTAEIVPRNAALRTAARALGLSERRDGVEVEIDIRPLATA